MHNSRLTDKNGNNRLRFDIQTPTIQRKLQFANSQFLRDFNGEELKTKITSYLQSKKLKVTYLPILPSKNPLFRNFHTHTMVVIAASV